jgi:surface protein
MKAFFYLKTHFRHLMAFLCLFCLTAGSMAQTKWSEVLWCADNSTLYFIQRENNTANPGKWGSLNVDRLAVAQSVDNSGTYKPVWLEIVRPNVKRVVFDSSFANAAPFSTAYWFYDMVNLEEINGLSYLNTSRVTTMRCMFQSEGN